MKENRKKFLEREEKKIPPPFPSSIVHEDLMFAQVVIFTIKYKQRLKGVSNLK